MGKSEVLLATANPGRFAHDDDEADHGNGPALEHHIARLGAEPAQLRPQRARRLRLLRLGLHRHGGVALSRHAGRRTIPAAIARLATAAGLAALRMGTAIPGMALT